MTAAFDRLVHHPSGRERYLPEGRLIPVGRVFRQPLLAATLARLAEPDGAAWFQRGVFAERFVNAVGASGGALTLADMRAYEPRWLDPLPFSYRGEEFVGSPPPDSGGLYCGFALGVLERTSLAQLGPWFTTPRALALIARVLSEADAVAARYVTDPLAFGVPVAALLAPESLTTTARVIEDSFPIGELQPLATTSAPAAPVDQGGRAGLPPTHSHHLVIVDADGNWASALHTGYATDFGTGLVVDGVGVNAANVFPGVGVGPGRRVCTPMAAVLGLRAGRPWLGLGTPGYPPPYVTLVLLNLLADGMTLPEAIDAPRFRLDAQRPGPRAMWDIGQVMIETRVPAATVAGLTRLGLTVAPLGDYGHVGAVQAVMVDAATGELLGVADTRLPGRAAGY
jgi:gamma-glutamyltranspeptidase/glutathione hydrolase